MHKLFLTAAVLCSAAIFIPGAARNGQASVSAAARPDVVDDLSARCLIGQEPSPAAMPMPIPVIRPEVHPRIHVHVQQPVIEVDRDDMEIDRDADADADMDHDIEIEHEEMDHDVDHDEPDFDMDVDRDDPELRVRAEEKVQKTFAMPAAHRTLEIDNIWGSIEVVGTSSNEAQLTVNKTYRAESKEKLEEARKKVTLDITDQPDSLKLYVNGPFCCNCNDGCGHRDYV